MLRIYTFGRCQIDLDDQTDMQFGSRKAMALLVYLACADTPQSRERLAELLWAERWPDQAQSNLRTVLARLNKQVESYLEVTRYSVGFQPEVPVWSDVQAVGRYLEVLKTDSPWPALKREQVQQALDLYQGDFLAGFYVRDCPEFETWVLQEQERWRQTMTLARSRLVAEYMAGGMVSAALTEALHLVAADPLNEEAQRQLMRLYAYTDQPHAALAQYEQCRAALESELGVGPAEETTALYEQIRAGAIRLPRHVSKPFDNLPQPPTSFFGRKDELAHIARQFGAGCRLLTLVGLGGIGKTRLAIAAAHQLKAEFEQGVCFVSLAHVTAEIGLLTALMAALRLPGGTDASEPLTYLMQYLHNKSLLVVLDNCEQLAGSPRVLSQLLAAAPQLKLLVTSRERLQLQEEWVLEVNGLTDEESSALLLFAERAQRVVASFALEPQRAHVERICALVDEMPLAIELAAAWVNKLSIAQIAARLEQDFDLLQTELRDMPERQRNLQALLAGTWQLLEVAEQQALMRLSLFRGGWVLEAAETVAAVNLDTLTALVEKSLVRLQTTGRYTFHSLIRRFARQKLADHPLFNDTRQRFLAYYVTLPDPRTDIISVDWFKQIESEYPNLLAALEVALTQPETAPLALTISTKIWLYWFRGGYWQEGLHWLTIILNRTAGMSELRAYAYLWAAVLAFRLGRPEQGMSLLQTGRQMAERLDFKEGLALVLQTASFATETYEEKAALLEQSLSYSRAVPRSLVLLYSLYLYGDAAREHSHLDQAEGLYREALAQATERGYLDIIIYAGGNLGRLALLRGQMALAKPQLEKAVAFARESGNRVNIADWLLPLGWVALYRREMQQATVYLQECYDLWQEMGIEMGRANALNALAELALATSDLRQATRYLHDGLSLWFGLWQSRSLQTLDLLRGIIDCLLSVGRLAHPAEAVTLLASAEQIRSSIVYHLEPPYESAYLTTLSNARQSLPPAEFERAWTGGQSLSLDNTFNLALLCLEQMGQEPVPKAALG
ncbi:MAG: AAA family ATPase [Anaerolineales bacterium]|nr:AAA family ATPase [Anaerolineales bacterium]